MRSLCKATLRMGLVSIPVKLYLAAASKAVHFCLVTPAGNRVKMQYVDEMTRDPVKQDECARGYDVGDGALVIFSKEEIKDLDEEENGALDIDCFVSEEELDPLRIEKTYYVGPDKGGDRAYDLLRQVLRKDRRMAMVRWTNRGKQHLLALKADDDRFVAHQLFLDDEIRPFSVKGPTKSISCEELDAAFALVDSKYEASLDMSKYVNEHEARVREAVDRKIKGLPSSPRKDEKAPALDLLEALKKSVK